MDAKVRGMSTVRENREAADRNDEELVREVVARSPQALTALYTRYAPVVFHIACQSLDTPSAEEIVQDVFLTVWQKADTFDRARGAFRPWMLQIAHYRILNELRSRSRRPQAQPDADGTLLDGIPDPTNGPAEEAWEEYRRQAVRSAVGRLPSSQRQALSLAFFEDLTHEQVAETLHLPLGTVKTRIRGALQKMRVALVALGVTALAAVLFLGPGRWVEGRRPTAERTAWRRYSSQASSAGPLVGSGIASSSVPSASGCACGRLLRDRSSLRIR